MASAKASKVKARKFPQDEFSVPLNDALDLLLAAQDFATVSSTDTWHFQVDGTVLTFTRTRVPEDT